MQISRDKADTILEGSKSVSNHKQDTEKKAENQDWILVERRKKNNGRNKDMGKDFQYADKGKSISCEDVHGRGAHNKNSA